ncbi:MAG: hypothetical protein AB7S92_21830 [Parvibaculaceae bacterium]
MRLIYRLALEGDGTTGQMGVRNIAAASSPVTADTAALVRFTAS